MDEIEPRLRGLMLAGLAGEAEPYRRLLDELSRLLRAFYGRRCPPGLDAEDLVQETLIAVHSRRATYDPGQPFTAWAYAIARYKLIDALRRARLHLRAPAEEADALFSALDAAGGAEAAMAARDLERVMAVLPARTRDLIRETKIDGLSTREAAQRHGMTESAVKVAIHRGLKSLGGQYGGSDVEGD
ncbi:sigma-70 family RNA polymerase sigma factor [Phenylobacterium sp.]|uniref:sigma-70 family RNA polymerase sigma factor n=1 Tax=Phenylobacterium sp. TaxID=1871053 RepID=UPI0012105C14|nr:sigma-70 family RNA polymerase sigma factor [Phenylobacterium sp.]THD58805.1 MAG: sigma-70 family RNA polymerase sigma factor [Phenylobacterium sp.]